LAFACSQLVHIFPRVRRYAAEQLYVSLLEHPEHVVAVPENDGEAIKERLLNFPWDGENRTATSCYEMAQKVAAGVGVPLSVGLAPLSDVSTKKQAHRDDFASYAALVDTINKV
jgi:hypothetical protein